LEDVNKLIGWEREVLTEYFPKYDPDDDSETEEARRHARKKIEPMSPS
jgi:hypothetical protein